MHPNASHSGRIGGGPIALGVLGVPNTQCAKARGRRFFFAKIKFVAYYKTSTLRVTSTYQIGGLNLKGPRPHPQGRGI